jgi:hypothetical protein
MKILLKLFVLSISFYCLLTACKKDDNKTNTNGLVTSISGKIENWTLGSDKEIKICVFSNSTYISFGSSAVDINGNFNISSLSAPTSDLLISVDSKFDGFTISNHSAMIIDKKVKFKIFGSDLNNPVREVSKAKQSVQYTETTGDFYVSFIYTNQDVNISGAYSETGTIISQNGTYNLTLKTGWNKVVNKLVNQTNNTYEISNIEPDGASWN